MDKNIRLLGFGAGVRALGVSMVVPFISLYLRNVLHVGYTQIGVLLVVVSVVPLAISPVGGLVTDRVGRRRLFLLSLGVEAASTIVVALSMQYSSLAGIILGGSAAGLAGGALAGPAISAYTADFAVGSDRTVAFTWQRIGFNAGFTVGVAMGGSLIGFIGFPEVGYLGGAVMGVAAVLLLLTLSPSPYDLARSGRGSGSLQSGPGSVGNSVSVLVHDRYFLVFCLATLLASLTEGQWGTTLPLYVNTVLNVPYAVLGIALSLNGLIVTVGQTPTTKLMTGRKHTTSAVYGVLLYVAAFLGLGLLGVNGVAVFVSVGALIVLLTFGENFSAIPMMTVPSNLAPGSELGSYNGAFNMVAGIGYSVAPVMGGLALGATSNGLLVWTLLVIPAVPGIFLFLWLGSRFPREVNTV